MSTRHLESLFKPHSVALIEVEGSAEDRRLTPIALRNLSGAGFRGEIAYIGRTECAFDGIRCAAGIAALPAPPEVAVLTGAPSAMPRLVDELGRHGVRTVVILSGDDAPCSPENRKQAVNQAFLDAAAPYGMRIVGPGALGIINPGAGFNASYAHARPQRGDIAFVTRSAAVASSVLDWAVARNIGFSHLAALGEMSDVGFGDMLDYLSTEPDAKAILLHMEAVANARKFMSAARAASRMKPVVVLKPGRFPRSSRTFSPPDPNAPFWEDAVHHAAFRRAGMLRVDSIRELFDATATLAFSRSFSGDRLAVLTNGGAIGVLAADAVLSEGGRLAELSPDSSARIAGLFLGGPPSIAGGVIDIHSDAPGDRYKAALEALFTDKGVDSVLTLHHPNALAPALETAQAIVDALGKNPALVKQGRIFTCWMGEGEESAAARALFTKNKISAYETPHEAVRGFMQVIRHRRNQEVLMETPPTVPEDFRPDTDAARQVVHRAITAGATCLTNAETKAVLAAYGVPLLDGPAPAGEPTGFGLTAESCPMPRRSPHTTGMDLCIGVVDGSPFGPAILFGHGGPGADLIQDQALALPPLNMGLAKDLIFRTRISKLMVDGRGEPLVDIAGVALTLVKISQLVSDVAEITNLEINPLRIGPEGVAAIDAQIGVGNPGIAGAKRFAVRPYPKEMEETITLPDGQEMLLRPLRPEDEPVFLELFSHLSRDEIRMRFLSPMKALPHTLAARLTQLDYDREMAIGLFGRSPSGAPVLYGGARLSADANNERAEFAILLRTDMTGLGLGPMLMRRIINYAKACGVKEVYGDVLGENSTMLRLSKAFGFSMKRTPDDPGVIYVSLNLSPEAGTA